MKLIDTHTHLYLQEFSADIDEVMHRAANAGVTKFFLPAIDSETVNDLLNFEAAYPGRCYAMMGLHPVSVKGNYKDELSIVETHLNERAFVAIGEIGLDFYWDTTFQKEQSEAFNMQMEIALHYKLPIVIHTRNAMRQTIDAVKPFAAKGLNGIFHCFGDSYAIAKVITDTGFLLGIGGVLTYKKANVGESIKDIPLDCMVLETDAPYLTPVPFRGKRNESSYLTYIAQTLAEVKKVDIEQIAETTTLNAEKIFRQ